MTADRAARMASLGNPAPPSCGIGATDLQHDSRRTGFDASGCRAPPARAPRQWCPARRNASRAPTANPRRSWSVVEAARFVRSPNWIATFFAREIRRRHAPREREAREALLIRPTLRMPRTGRPARQKQSGRRVGARERLRAADDRARAADHAEIEARLGLESLRESVLVELAGLGDLRADQPRCSVRARQPTTSPPFNSTSPPTRPPLDNRARGARSTAGPIDPHRPSRRRRPAASPNSAAASTSSARPTRSPSMSTPS